MAEIVTTAELTRRGFLSFTALAGIGVFFRAPEVVAEAVNAQAVTPSESMGHLSQVRANLTVNGYSIKPESWSFAIDNNLKARTVRLHVELPVADAEIAMWNYKDRNIIGVQLFYPSGVQVSLTTSSYLKTACEESGKVIVELEEVFPSPLAKYIK